MLQNSGFDFLVIECKKKSAKFGNRVISKEAFKKFKKYVGVSEEIIVNEIRKFKFVSPSGVEVEVKNGARGYVVKQENLLSQLERNFEGRLENRNRLLSVRNNVAVVNGKTIEFNILVGADGVHSTVRSTLNLEEPQIIKCYAEERSFSGTTAVFFDNKLIPEFYGWIMELEDATVEVGVGVGYQSNVYETFQKFVRKFKLDDGERLDVHGGCIPISIVERPAMRNIVLIGDASGGEPLMGASLHKCIDEAKLCCEVLEKFDTQSFSSAYNSAWREIFYSEFRSQTEIKNVIRSMTNRELDELFARVSKKGVHANKGFINPILKEIVRERECRTS